MFISFIGSEEEHRSSVLAVCLKASLTFIRYSKEVYKCMEGECKLEKYFMCKFSLNSALDDIKLNKKTKTLAKRQSKKKAI